MSYLRKFSDLASYESFKNSGDWVTPNVSVVEDVTYFNRYYVPPAFTGDVAYWDGSKVKTTPLSSWDTSLGTAIGVVVIPTGFAPDGKVRIIGLTSVDKHGNQSYSPGIVKWGPTSDTSLTNYTKVPSIDNAGSTSSGSDSYGFLPSDEFWGATSFVDPKAKYYDDTFTPHIPSPYLGDSPNPEYYKTLSGNNALSDFNGLSNTQTLVGLGSDYEAANACWKYNDGASTLQWYLPGMGELGYLLPRFDEINRIINTLGGISETLSNSLWSSTENSSSKAYHMDNNYGEVSYYEKTEAIYVRPFATI